MSDGGNRFDVVVVGCGIAGLSAAVSACQQGAKVAVLERATFEERGGNTRYTEGFLRMNNDSEVSDDFETELAVTGSGYLDPALVHESSAPYEQWPPIVKSMNFVDPEVITAFSSEAGPTLQWLKGFGGSSIARALITCRHPTLRIAFPSSLPWVVDSNWWRY